MFRIGCHLSASGGYLAMGKTAVEIGANTYQYFTRNPRGSSAKAVDAKDIGKYLEYANEHGLDCLLAHAPFTLNLCSDKEDIRRFARETLADDISRVELLPGTMYNLHPGSHVGQGEETGLSMIIDALNSILRPEQAVMVLLETMAGKGSELGCTFGQLRAIIDGVELDGKLGVCFDTCHVYDAGYDVVNDLDGVLAEFDRVVGIGRLRAVHVNDSKNPMGSRKDRHEAIGSGSLGIEAFRRIVNNPLLRDLPFILETPNELPGYAAEIETLKGLRI